MLFADHVERLALLRDTLATRDPGESVLDAVRRATLRGVDEVIADAATRHADPATDLQARLLARAAWGATRSARELWVHSRARLDPRPLVDEAFNLLRHGCA